MFDGYMIYALLTNAIIGLTVVGSVWCVGRCVVVCVRRAYDFKEACDHDRLAFAWRREEKELAMLEGGSNARDLETKG